MNVSYDECDDAHTRIWAETYRPWRKWFQQRLRFRCVGCGAVSVDGKIWVK